MVYGCFGLKIGASEQYFKNIIFEIKILNGQIFWSQRKNLILKFKKSVISYRFRGELWFFCVCGIVIVGKVNFTQTNDGFACLVFFFKCILKKKTSVFYPVKVRDNAILTMSSPECLTQRLTVKSLVPLHGEGLLKMWART